ncbi:MAG: FtsB family cell division protein, partial [Acidimicrobiales bacterium]
PDERAPLRTTASLGSNRSPRRRRRAAERPVERRRARALLVASAVFAAIVLASALPWSTLLSQHDQLTSATAEVSALQAENRALSAQARQLSGTATQTALAREDYGLVSPGQQAYAILPPSGSAPSNVVDAGHVPLDEPPVVPGSRRSEALLGAGVEATAATGTTASADATRSAGVTRPSGTSGSGSRGPGGFWSRVAHTLEFWS